MGINTTLESASTTAASNGPSGSDQRTIADDGLRQYLAFIKSLKTLAVLASATTVTPPSTANAFSVTGTTAITTIASTNSWDGRDILFIFAGILTLTNGSNLILPGSANITTAVGDAALMVQLASGQWRCVAYSRADGSLVVSTQTLTNLTLTGNLSVQGNTTLGNASGDTLTIHPNAVTWQNDPTHSANHTYSGNVTVTGNGTINGNTVLGNAGTDTITTTGNVTMAAASAGITLTVAGTSGGAINVNDSSASGPYMQFARSTSTIFGYMGDAARIFAGGANTDVAIRSEGNLVMGAGGDSMRLVVTTDGRLYGNALHNNGGAVTGTTNQYIASGTYTPTITDSTNVTGHSAGVFTWTRTGNVVNVAGSTSITTTAGSVSLFRVSLPIASNLASIGQLAGSGGHSGAVAIPIVAYEEISTDQAECMFVPPSGGTRQAYVTFQYVVV